MSKRLACRFLYALAATLALASLALAQEVMILHHSKVGNGPSLEGGTYQVKVVRNADSSDALFYRADNLYLRVPVTVVVEKREARRTEVYYHDLAGKRVITKICLRGSKETLVFQYDAPKPH